MTTPPPGYPGPGYPPNPYGAPAPYGGQYPPRPGYGPAGYGQGGYPPRPPSPVTAYLGAALFLGCSILSFVVAGIGWSGTTSAFEATAALVGIAFQSAGTTNHDYAISITISVACTILLFAILLACRLGFGRWLAGGLGALVSAYYVYALIYILSNGGASVIALVVVAMILWLAATVTAFLPATAKAMRGAAQRAGYPPQGYPPPGGYPPPPSGYAPSGSPW